MHENNGYQMVSGHPRKCGRPVLSADGRKRRCVTGSVDAATADELTAWREARHAVKPITKMGDLFDHLIPWAKANGYDPKQ